MRTFRVFVSSPGDVESERQSAHQILLTLPEEPAWQGKLGIQVVRWDNPRSPTPMYANYTPQEAVNRNLPKPSECDLAVFLLWSRFGTPLAEPLKPDGGRYLSGTEWEYENAISAKVPVLLYRRIDDPQVSLRDHEFVEKQRQLFLVDGFFERFKGPEGAATGGYLRYKLAEFETLFKRVIESTFRQFIESERTSPSQPSALEIIDRLTRQLEETARENARLKEMLVLREGTPEPIRQPRPGEMNPEAQLALGIEVKEIDGERAEALSRDRDVVAVAPVLPLKLIAPVHVRRELDVSNTAWGVSAVRADASPFTGEGVVVAILDTGIDAAHPAFAGVTLVQKDFTGEGDTDQNGHGTHFAGTVFGRDVDGTRIGVARGVKKALIGKVIGSQGGSTDALVSAVQWAVNEGADVIAMSVAFDAASFERKLMLDGLPTEIAKLRAFDAYRANASLFERLLAMITALSPFTGSVLILAAAGNDSQRGTNANAEAAVSLPAACDGIISVAALTQASDGLTIAPFSNTGAALSAPGSDITSAKVNGGLISFSGTSMAVAHTAGVAALWAEKLRRLGNLGRVRLESRLLASATRDGLQGGSYPLDIGAGLVRAPEN
jgi:hypothetical protein